MSEDIVDNVSILVSGAVVMAFGSGFFAGERYWFFAIAAGIVSLLFAAGLVLLVDKMAKKP